MITLEGLSVIAGAFTLRDISIALPRGQWGIVIGPAGSGKTTLLETIAGVRHVASGRVILRGADVTSMPPELRGVGIVYQHGYLFPHLSVEENVLYGVRDSPAAAEVARRLGADALYGRPVSSLSGGERQVVALARAIAPAPDILLLDEPFAALDQRRRRRVRQELQLIQRECQLTVLHVTHDFVEARMLGDVAMVLDEGFLRQTDTPERLFLYPASTAVAEFLDVEEGH